MPTIDFPSRPEKTIMSAEFDMDYGRVYRVRLTRVINGKNDYSCEVLTEGVSEEIASFISDHVVHEAKRNGAFEVMGKIN